MSETDVKRILGRYAVPVINLNIVKSILFIGLPSQDIRDYFDKLLSPDLFL
jgi:hypothetical protein